MKTNNDHSTNRGHFHREREKGFSVAEILVALAVFFLVVTLGFSGFQSFQSRSRITSSVRTATSALNTARYLAIEKNKSIKLTLAHDQFLIMEKICGEWKAIRKFELARHTTAAMNASPVFSSTGFVAPLCSITIENETYRYKITISIAGRVKVVKI